MNKQQHAIIRRLRKAVADAKAAGLVTFCDMEAWGIRLVPKEDIEGDEDPRDLGEVVDMPDEGPVGMSKSDLKDLGEVVVCESTCGTPCGSKDGIPVV